MATHPKPFTEQLSEDNIEEVVDFNYTQRTTFTQKELKQRLKKYQKLMKMNVICDEIGCGKVFKSDRNLRKHKNTVHSNLRPWQCEWPGCQSAFKTKESLVNHRKIHLNERSYKCDFNGCEKSFNLRSELTQHSRIHDPNRPSGKYPCSWPACGQFCQSEQALNEHMNRHQNIKPFGCEYESCDKSYYTSYELRQHVMKNHTNTDIFHCDYGDCDKKFSTKRDMNAHRRRHVDRAPYACSWPQVFNICQKSLPILTFLYVLIVRTKIWRNESFGRTFKQTSEH